MTRFLRSYFHTEREALRPALYHTVRAGHLVGDKTHVVERETLAGHELVYCLRGTGTVRVGGKTHRVRKRGLYWVSCWHPHAYRADAQDPWELYWVRIEGPGLDALARVLRIADLPVFPQLEDAGVQACFHEAFALFDAPSPASPAKMHATIARLLGLLYENRFRDADVDALTTVPSALERPLVRMRQHYADSLRLADLSALAGMSVSHFIRTFKRSMGTSPIDWLRRERINQAKRRLIDTEEPVKEIARQCGYRDPYFFSKDFKKLTGLPPTAYRERERGAGKGK